MAIRMPQWRWPVSAFLAIGLLWAGGAAADSLQPPGWDTGVTVADAIDTNPDPRIVEISIEARVQRVTLSPSLSVEAWTYNGGVPGPVIRVRVGDRLIVHFTNHLPQPTTIHWHGLRIPIQMDGVPGHSQPEVLPGRSFTYDFVVPDAGLFWYHPHVMSNAQVGFGLYGALLVEDPQEARTVGVADELVMVLSDMSIVPEGSLEPADAGGSIGDVFGREGTHVLLNGREQSSPLTIRANAPQRWRVVNAAKSRYFNLDLGGTVFKQIGGDGGLQEYAVESDTLVLAPGERADVIVAPTGKPGEVLTLKSVLFYRGFGTIEGRFPYDDLATLTIANLPAYAGPPPPDTRRAIASIDPKGATPVDLQFTLVQEPGEAPLYRILGPLFSPKTKTVRAALGETQVWTITNKSSWSHPFHLHGFFFQILDEKGAPVRPMAWKDTVNIPYDQTLRVIVRFDDRPGSWMFHCHILDHAEGGLMGMVEVGTGPGDHGHGPDTHGASR